MESSGVKCLVGGIFAFFCFRSDMWNAVICIENILTHTLTPNLSLNVSIGERAWNQRALQNLFTAWYIYIN